MKNDIKITDTNIDYKKYYELNSVSSETQEKLSTTDFVIVPARYNENEFYFAQESIDFIKYCKQNNNENSFDILSDGDISIRSLHSFDIWLPIIHIAQFILLPIAINLVASYIDHKIKGREKEDANVDVVFIVKRDGEEKTIHYSGDAKTFKKSFDKIDLNKM